MRFQGRLRQWKDDQGYGFVTPNGGGDRAFVHVNAFSSKARRPVDGDMINYEVVKDGKGRLSAVKISYVSAANMHPDAERGASFGMVFLGAFLLVLIVAVVMRWLPIKIVAFYLMASVLAFVAYAIDKLAAQNNRWRTKERTLHLLAIAGGWPGALLAQRIIRHKSRKQGFQQVFWLTVLVNCVVLGWLLTNDGAVFLRSILN